MTTKEAEEQYYREVEEHIKLHIFHVKIKYIVLSIVGLLALIAGIILTIIGFNTPPEITSWGYESEPFSAIVGQICGIPLLITGVCIVLFINIYLIVETKRGPKNFLPQIKNLYLNYLRCENMNDSEKEFYKQKLENIRNAELVNAINTAAASTSAVVMFSALHKQ